MQLVEYNVVLKKSVYAEFTLYIPKFDLEIAKCREFRTNGDKGERRWFSFPSYYSEGGASPGWRPTVKFRLNATESALWDAVKVEIDNYLAANPEVEVKAQDFSNPTTELPF